MEVKEFMEIALSYNETERNPHFDRTSFKVKGKRIFATLHEPSKTVNMKLSLIEQSIFSKFEGKSIYPVPNKFGEKGWTTFEIENLPKELIEEALRSAYSEVFIVIKK